jgi:hypothetical protein
MLPCPRRNAGIKIRNRHGAGIQDQNPRQTEDSRGNHTVRTTRIRHQLCSADCGLIRALFVDIDFKHTPENEARARLDAFRPEIDILVHSGAGFHAYWLLDPPCDLQRDGEADLFKKHLRGLAKALGGDIACAEPAHVLRIPETLNHKYSPPREVRLVQHSRLSN